MKKKILIEISNPQTSLFYKAIPFLKDYFDITCLCFHTKENVNVEHLPGVVYLSYRFKWRGWFYKIINHIFFYIDFIKYLKKAKYDLVVLSTIPSIRDSFLFVFKLFLPKQKFYIQVFTPLGESKILKRIYSWNLKRFRYVSGKSEKIIKELNLYNKKMLDVGLGYSDNYGFQIRTFEKINLVYLGVWREGLDKAIYGFYNFAKKYQDEQFNFHIIGGWNASSVNIVREIIDRESLACSNANVIYHGFLESSKVAAIFKEVNVGVSFVPKLPMYDGVSVTKTIEYFLAGMPVIGTSVSFNNEYIKSDTGVLCEDTMDSFCKALDVLYSIRHAYDSSVIRGKYEHLTIKNKAENILLPNFKQILNVD